MVDSITVLLGVVAILGVVFAGQILGSIRLLVGNAAGGLVVLLFAGWVGFGVTITPLTVVITAIAGVPGAVLILLLSFGGVAFVPPAGHAPGRALVDMLAHNFHQILAGGHDLLDFINETNSSMNSTG